MARNNTLPSAPPLSQLIKVKQSSMRSVHIAQDLPNIQMSEDYLVTARGRADLTRILDGLYSLPPTRAWTLTGPYGTGKSYFSLMLMNLFCAELPGHQRAIELLQSVDPELTNNMIDRLHLHSSSGFFVVPVPGTRIPFYESLRNSLISSLSPYSRTRGFNKLIKELSTWGSETAGDQISSWFTKLEGAFLSQNLPFQGILLILDELGKLLEYAAANPDQSDIFIFQELAERANRSGTFPIVVIGVLHQAFERYAALSDSTASREWAKVQGRFEDIAFQEPAAMQMRLLARALEKYKSTQMPDLSSMLNATAVDVWRSGWQPPLITCEQFLEITKSAYPLHPATLVALPYIFNRLGQNERSLVAYLASSEPSGFQEFIQTHKPPNFLRLPYLFDYLSINYEWRLYGVSRARALTETIEILNSEPNLTVLEVDILKTIGLINWLADVGAIKATEPIVMSALRDTDYSDDEIRASLTRLKMRSLLVFRRFNATYRIWQGSDVDIEERLDVAHKQLSSNISLAEIIQSYLPPIALAARRNSYQSGTLRLFETRYIDIHNYLTTRLDVKPGAAGIVFIALPASPSEIEIFKAWAASDSVKSRHQVVIGILERSTRLSDLAQELRALHWVNGNTPELGGDPVARRELRSRLAAVESLIQAEFNNHLNLHNLFEAKSCAWFWQGEQLSFSVKTNISHLLSDICDKIYYQSPIIWNELINRRSLSAQAAAARRNLIEAMLTRQHMETLGIEGYPPERSIYETLLMKSGIHAQRVEGWALGEIPINDPLRLRYVWRTIETFIFKPPVQPRLVSDLFDLLIAPPYGITQGILPVLLCAFLSVNSAETTLYREGTLLPEPSVADWEVLLRRPELFSIAGFRAEGDMMGIIQRLSRSMNTEPAIMPIVRSLVRRVKALPEHAWRTQKLPQEALSVRNLIETAHSPERLLFHDLPRAVHLDPFDEVDPKPEIINLFFERLNGALQALANVTPQLEKWARDHLLQCCGLAPGVAGWENFREISKQLVWRVNDPALSPLLKRTTESADDQIALGSVLAFVANRPLRVWSDADAINFSNQAKAFGELFQVEQRTYFPTSRLSNQHQKRFIEIASNIRNTLCVEFGNDPHLLLAVTQALATELIRSTLDEKGDGEEI